jgi:phosphate transport system protein
MSGGLQPPVDQQPTSKTSRELNSLRELMLRMGQLSEEILARSLKAVWERDREAAMQIAELDLEIDRLDVEIDQAVLRSLALLAPVAQDLREVVAAKTMATDLERVGDLARNIAKSAIRLADRGTAESPASLRNLATECQEALALALRAYADVDSELAREVLDQDDIIDDDEDEVIRGAIRAIHSDPESSEQAIDLIFIAQSLERVADHATNIAEDVILIAESLNLKHAQKLSS